ncbi:hypothetical protein JB92DRAFT_2925194 [Gautieria morchelliformis]|nr:hypothetical protein JB92DRAFT_2925194 [Gautieria morchelliformis]
MLVLSPTQIVCLISSMRGAFLRHLLRSRPSIIHGPSPHTMPPIPVYMDGWQLYINSLILTTASKIFLARKNPESLWTIGKLCM